MTVADQYKQAMAEHEMDPGLRQMSAILGMGFLMGAGMYGAAEALVALYVREYGWDALPDMVKELEGEE